MNPVFIHDPVYGEVHFTEPLLIDLYHSTAVQRLRGIYQGGISAFIKPERQTTRLDHSVGVAALLRYLGVDVEEQAAGLIHDVPHTAMSHVIDFVFPNHEHTYHEEHRHEMLKNSDLPDIFARYTLDWEYVSEAENYTALEQPLPTLCADRLDYFLRDGLVDWGMFTADTVRDFLAHLQIWEGKIVVDNMDAARWLGEQFIRLDDACWCSVQEVGWYAVAANALRAALKHHVITEADFLETDVALFERLRDAAVPAIQRWLALLRPDVDFVRVNVQHDIVALPKVRAVDPPVLVNGHIAPLSQLDLSFARHRTEYVNSKQGEWKLKIINP